MSSRVVLIALVVVAAVAAADTDYKIDPGLMKTLTDSEEAVAPFFVVFGERPSLAPAHYMRDWTARGRFVVQSLQATAARSQAGVRGYLQGRGVAHTAFWVENKIYVPKGDLDLARALSLRPEVVAILPEVIYRIPTPQTGGVGIQSIAWGVSKIRADQVWPTANGAGMVVANIDTGVQYNHPALVNQYRGNLGGGVFDHVGNWKDPAGGYCTPGIPCDNNGHGTHTMGTMVGTDGTNQIGVAPGAKWIACKGCTTNTCPSSALTACAQWIMDPLENSSGLNRPHVVNNSWGGSSGNAWYLSYVNNWRAAGIFPAFSNGNNGPSCGTAGSPGDYAESFASGATNSLDVIASFSSRGPSAFGGIIKPNVSAPGVSVYSSVPTNGFAYYSGTSMASPHTAGAVALVWSAAPLWVGNVGGTEALFEDTAAVLTTTETCGGIPAGASPNNTYGYGRLDAFAAFSGTGTPPNQPPVVDITSPAGGTSYNCPATVGFTGTASDPEDGDRTSLISWTEGASQFGTGGSASKDYTCTQTGNHTITASVTDSDGASASDTVTINIRNDNVPAAPSGLKATVSGKNVTLKWKSNSTNEQGFKVERKPKTETNWVQIGTTGAGVVIFPDTVPAAGTYQYHVRAFNGAGDSAYSNVATARVR